MFFVQVLGYTYGNDGGHGGGGGGGYGHFGGQEYSSGIGLSSYGGGGGHGWSGSGAGYGAESYINNHYEESGGWGDDK